MMFSYLSITGVTLAYVWCIVTYPTFHAVYISYYTYLDGMVMQTISVASTVVFASMCMSWQDNNFLSKITNRALKDE